MSPLQTVLTMAHVESYPKAPCSFIVDTWALKGLPCYDFGVYAYAIKLHGAFGIGPNIRFWVGAGRALFGGGGTLQAANFGNDHSHI